MNEDTDIGDPLDRWETQMRKGTLGLAVLASLWSGRLYGLEILRRLEADADLLVSEGAIYPLLTRLKTEGLIASEWVEADAGHPRKYFSLTDQGRRQLRGMVGVWDRFASGLERLVTPLRKDQGQ